MENVIRVKSWGEKLTTKDLTYIALFAAIIAICSWISIPTAVPFTMQTFAVFAAIGILGMKRGTLAVSVYILLGAIGVPVFAGFTGGLGVLFGKTGGYIIGFVGSALVSGAIIGQFGKKTWVMGIAMLIGLIVCYAFGTAWFMYFYARATGPIGVMSALSWCVFPFVVPDMIKIVLAIVVSRRIGKSV